MEKFSVEWVLKFILENYNKFTPLTEEMCKGYNVVYNAVEGSKGYKEGGILYVVDIDIGHCILAFPKTTNKYDRYFQFLEEID